MPGTKTFVPERDPQKGFLACRARSLSVARRIERAAGSPPLSLAAPEGVSVEARLSPSPLAHEKVEPARRHPGHRTRQHGKRPVELEEKSFLTAHPRFHQAAGSRDDFPQAAIQRASLRLEEVGDGGLGMSEDVPVEAGARIPVPGGNGSVQLVAPDLRRVAGDDLAKGDAPAGLTVLGLVL